MGSVKIFFEEVKKISIDRKRISLYINDLISEEKFRKGDISIIFCSDDYLLNINREHLNHDYYTDIVTFDYSEDNLISGDLFISLDRVKDNAGTYGEPYERELYRVVFHGVLHLTGYTDHDDDERLVMREKENYYLKKFGF
jgi:rRNA maturation RNase YbeY